MEEVGGVAIVQQEYLLFSSIVPCEASQRTALIHSQSRKAVVGGSVQMNSKVWMCWKYRGDPPSSRIEERLSSRQTLEEWLLSR